MGNPMGASKHTMLVTKSMLRNADRRFVGESSIGTCGVCRKVDRSFPIRRTAGDTTCKGSTDNKDGRTDDRRRTKKDTTKLPTSSTNRKMQ